MLPYVNEGKGEENEEERRPSYYEKKEREVSFIDRVLLNRPSKVVAIIIIFSILIPLLLYSFVLSSTLDLPPSDDYSAGSCILPRTARLPCGIGNVTQSQCHSECCYDLNNNLCFHRVPSRFSYITDREPSFHEEMDLRSRIATEPFSNQETVQTLRLAIDEISATHLALTFYDPRAIPPRVGNKLDDTNYSYNVSQPELIVEVFSTSGNTLFSTIRGPLIAAENIWEITFRLTNETMYGLGEIPLQPDTVRVLYSNNQRPDSIPLIFAKLNGSYHGLLIDVSAPVEITVFDENQIIVRSITNVSIKLHIFVGPEPKDIMQDVMSLIGFEKNLKYWMLGAHVCTETSESIEEASKDLASFLSEASTRNFNFDSHCGTRSVVLSTNCDDDQYLNEGATLIRNNGKKYVPHLSPYIRHEDETSSEEANTNKFINNDNIDNITCDVDSILAYEDIFIKDPLLTRWYTGLVDEYDVLYADYSHKNSSEFIEHFWRFNADYDGIILENTWPLDEYLKILNETHLLLPYFNENFKDAFQDTIPWNATYSNGKLHMYYHNEYGNHFVEAIKIFTNESIPIWTTSQWMNGGVIINRQNVHVTWANLHKELREISLAGISGNWFYSSPICGDTENFDPDSQINLCLKWYMAATFMPLIKIHSKVIPRHPLAFSGMSRNYMMAALNRRISFLPYFYTTLQTGPLLRPMFYQFPQSDYLQDINTQFSVGDDLLIVPNLLPFQSVVHVWVPQGHWYEIWSGLKLNSTEQPVTMATAEADFVTLVRGGAILALQEDTRQTADLTRKDSPFSIIIALECVPTIEDETTPDTLKYCEASGKLYMTSNMTIEFTSDANTLTITAEGDDFDSMCDDDEAIWANTISNIKIYGLDDIYNNNDYYRNVLPTLRLCNIRLFNRIVYNFV